MLPARIGGPKEEEKKPGLVVAIGLAKKPTLPTRIGGPKDEEPEGESEEMDNGKAKKEAITELMSAIDTHNNARAEAALEAFFYACDASPHDEGEHTEEEGEEKEGAE